MIKVDEYMYRKNSKYTEEIIISEEYQMLQINPRLLKNLNNNVFDNKGFITEKVLESWGNYDNFIQKSLGHVMVNKDRIVAAIIGTARFKDIISIDIETEDNHRNKGLALTLTNHFANECIDNGIIPQWNCMKSNIASRRTANRARFQLLKEDKVYWFEI